MKKGKFSRILVALCIAVVIIYTVWAVLEFRRSGQEAATLTTAVYGFFGTELALLCLKRIFAKSERIGNGTESAVNEEKVNEEKL